MNKKQMMKRIIGLSLLAGLFLPIVANADSYTVKSGDTLSAIAKEKNTTVVKFLRLKMQIQRRKPRSKLLLVKLILHKQQLLSLLQMA